LCTIEAIVNARDGGAPHEYHDAKLEQSVAGWYCDVVSAYVVELITEDVNAFAVVVEDVKTAFHVSFWIPERQTRSVVRCRERKANCDTEEEGGKYDNVCCGCRAISWLQGVVYGYWKCKE
jgi:hypothetical protein